MEHIDAPNDSTVRHTLFTASLERFIAVCANPPMFIFYHAIKAITHSAGEVDALKTNVAYNSDSRCI